MNTGLRLGELLGLRWSDVHSDVILVSHQLSRTGTYEEPKTKASKRRVPLFDDVSAFFEARRFAAVHPDDDSPVFSTGHGGPLMHRNTQRSFDRAREKARKNLKGGFQHDDGRPVSFHDLRHAFASRCASRGVAVGTLSAVMGHANVGITQGVYTHLYGRQEAEQAFREAMSGAEVGNSLSVRDGNQPEETGNLPEATSAFQD